MWNHKTVWAGIDALALRNDLTASGLAKTAGLDPTAFNPSKRQSADGRPRWPSTESIAKVLDATGTSLDDFVVLVRQGAPSRDRVFQQTSSVPVLGLAQAGVGGFFDDGGFPVGHGWREVELPRVGDDGAYALEVAGDSMMPLYRDGDIIIVSPSARVRTGDRVVVKTIAGEVTVKVLRRQTATLIELHALNSAHDDWRLPVAEVNWMARIVWASQ